MEGWGNGGMGEGVMIAIRIGNCSRYRKKNERKENESKIMNRIEENVI